MKLTNIVKIYSLYILPLVVCGGAFLVLASNTFAVGGACDPSVPAAVREANGCDATTSADQFTGTVISIINGIIAALGLLAVIFVVVGGINYLASGGDAAKVKKGRDTILYALVGLVVCVLSYAVVNFVIANIIGSGSGGSSGGGAGGSGGGGAGGGSGGGGGGNGSI